MKSLVLSILLLAPTSFLFAQCLTSMYDFEGNTSDISGNNVIATPSGATNSNGVMIFDGVNDYVELNNGNGVLPNGEFTVYVKAKINGAGGGVSGTQTLFSQRAHPTQSGGSIVNCNANSNGDINFVLRDGLNSTASRISYPAVQDNNWHCYAFVLESNNTMNIYLDGALVSSGNSSQQANWNVNLAYSSLGRHDYVDNSGTFNEAGRFNGEIDEFAVYSCALNASDIAGICENLYSSSPDLAEESSIISVYPNPAKDVLFIRVNGNTSEALNYQLIDMSGRTVQQGITNQNQIDLSFLNAGVYFLKVDGQKDEPIKVIAQ